MLISALLQDMTKPLVVFSATYYFKTAQT